MPLTDGATASPRAANPPPAPLIGAPACGRNPFACPPAGVQALSSKPLYLGLGAYLAGTLVVIAVLTAANYGSGEGAEGAKGEQVRLASTSAASDNARGQCLASCVTGCSSMVEVSGDPTGKGQALCIKSCSLACDGKARGDADETAEGAFKYARVIESNEKLENMGVMEVGQQ